MSEPARPQVDPPGVGAPDPRDPTADAPPTPPADPAAEGPSGRDRLHQVIDRTVAFVALLSAAGAVVDMSQSALDLAGLARAEALGRPFWALPWWSHDATLRDRIRAAVEAAGAGRTTRFDVTARVAGDGRLPMDVQISPIVGPDGRALELVASAIDISGRVAERERSEELLREMGHRIKNLLATVQAMARMTERVSPADTAFADFRARLDALVASHESLNDSATADEFFTRFAGRVLSPFLDSGRDGAGPRLTVSGPKRRLTREQAKLLGLCIHELATNSCKYGALSSDEGRVEMRLDHDPARGATTFLWRESGGPSVAPPRRSGYGTRFVTSTLRGVFEAEPTLDFDPRGLSVTVTGPAGALFAPSETRT